MLLPREAIGLVPKSPFRAFSSLIQKMVEPLRTEAQKRLKNTVVSMVFLLGMPCMLGTIWQIEYLIVDVRIERVMTRSKSKRCVYGMIDNTRSDLK
jgi:hypothetical protein